MAKYTYPAIFQHDGDGYFIYFPDIPGCFTEGDSIRDGIEVAEDVMAFTLADYEYERNPVPTPSDPRLIPLDHGSSVFVISADTDEYYAMRKGDDPAEALAV